jgi:hypothetical protein
MKNKDTYIKGVAKDQEWHTGKQGDFFTLDGSENLGVTDMFIDDGFDIIHQHAGEVHLSDLSPEEEETAIPKGSKKVKKTELKPRLDKGPFNIGLNESLRQTKNLNPQLMIGDEILVVSTEGIHDFGAPELYKPYVVVGIKKSKIYDIRNDYTVYYQIEPSGMTDEERTGAMLAGGGRMRPLYIFPPEGPHGGSDQWILRPGFLRGEGLNESAPKPGSSSAEGIKDEDLPYETKYLTLDEILTTVKSIPYYKEVLMDLRDDKDDWAVTQTVKRYADYWMEHPESLTSESFPPIQVIGDGLKDGAHRISTLNALANHIDPDNSYWTDVKLEVRFYPIEVVKDIGPTWVNGELVYNTKDGLNSKSLNEHIERGINPDLEVDDIIRVLDVDGEHARMPERFGTYKVVKVGQSYDEYYDITPYPEVESRTVRYYKELGAHHEDSDFTLYRGDIWIYADVDRNTINENKQPGLNPELEVGDIIRVIDIDGEHGRMPDRWGLYRVKDTKQSNNTQDFYYDIVPYVEDFDDFIDITFNTKSLYRGDTWIYADTPMATNVDLKTISEQENINDMVYIDEPREKHVKKMDVDLNKFKQFPINNFMNIPPPENESDTTQDEITQIEEIPVNNKFVDTTDDIHEHFERFLKLKNLEYPKEDLTQIMKEVSNIVLKLKYHYNRPRPQQVASAKDLQLNPTTLDTASTPSYPSGHATQGRFIGRYLTDIYPDYHDELLKVGDEVGDGRLMAKVHYPSDQAFGKVLGDELYNYYYSTKGLKLKEITLKEEMEELSPPLELGDKIMVWDLEADPTPPGSTNVEWKMPTTLLGTIVDVYDEGDIDEDSYRGGIKYVVRDDNSGEEYGLYQGTFKRRYSQSKMVRDLSGRDKWKIIGRYEKVVNEQDDPDFHDATDEEIRAADRQAEIDRLAALGIVDGENKLEHSPEGDEYGTFTRKDIIILNYLRKIYNKQTLRDIWEEPSTWGAQRTKWEDTMKLFGIKLKDAHVEDFVRSSRYARWAWDNWEEVEEYGGDFGKIPNPIKTTLKWYDVQRSESGTQVEYKSGEAEVLGFGDDDVSTRADYDFWEWGGEMETHDWGDYEQYDSDIDNIEFLRVDESISDPQTLLFNFWRKVGPTLDPDKLKLVGFNVDAYEDRSVVWDNLREYYGDEELINIIQERLEGLHDSWSYEYIVTDFNFDGDEIYLNVLVNGDTQIPIMQEEGGVIDMSLWDINEKAAVDILSLYDDIYDEARDSISDDIKDVLLKDLPVDVDLEYLDISEPGTFEEFVDQNEVKMIAEDDDGYIDEDLENWSYDGKEVGTVKEQVMLKPGDMIKSDIFKFLSNRFSLTPTEQGEIRDTQGNYYRLIDMEEPHDHVTLSHLLDPVVEFINYGIKSGSFEEGDIQKGMEAITDWLSLAMNQKTDYIN